MTSFLITVSGLLGDDSTDMNDSAEGKPDFPLGDWTGDLLGLGDLSSTRILLGLGLTL